MIDNKILKITENVHWIGVLDPEITTFDIVMETKNGTTYNSYLINSSKKVIVDTVKVKFWDEFEQKLRNLITPDEIEYIIVNHTEPDHSGSISKLLNLAPWAKVVGSGNAIKFLKDQLNHDFPNIIVKDGDIIDLGDMTLKVISAPNLHWPDSIFTYLEMDKVLFTCDVFGCHYCDDNMFDNMVGNFDVAFKYYFDVIMKPYSKFMLKAIEKISKIDINIICTGHGPILRNNWKRYVELSQSFSKESLKFPYKNYVFIPFVSAYGFTGNIARKIGEGLDSVGGIRVDICDIEKVSLEILNEKLSISSGLIVGSPTINQNILLQIYQLFSLINPLRDRGKLAASFGSYGWSGEATDLIENNLRNLKLNIFERKFFIKFDPSEDELKKAFEFGREFGIKLLENVID